MRMSSDKTYSSLESHERRLVLPNHVSLLDTTAAMHQPCDLLQVPGFSSSSRHQRLDRQSRGGKGDQGDF